MTPEEIRMLSIKVAMDIWARRDDKSSDGMVDVAEKAIREAEQRGRITEAETCAAIANGMEPSSLNPRNEFQQEALDSELLMRRKIRNAIRARIAQLKEPAK
jgi:hypothetical protein